MQPRELRADTFVAAAGEGLDRRRERLLAARSGARTGLSVVFLPVAAGAVQDREDLVAGVAGEAGSDQPVYEADQVGVAREDLLQESLPARTACASGSKATSLPMVIRSSGEDQAQAAAAEVEDAVGAREQEGVAVELVGREHDRGLGRGDGQHLPQPAPTGT